MIPGFGSGGSGALVLLSRSWAVFFGLLARLVARQACSGALGCPIAIRIAFFRSTWLVRVLSGRPRDAPGLDFRRRNDTCFDVCRFVCARFGITLRPLRNTAWAHEISASGFVRKSHHRAKTRFERCSQTGSRWQRIRRAPGSGQEGQPGARNGQLGASGHPPRALRPLLGRSWGGPGRPKSIPGRVLGVQSIVPKGVRKRFWPPEPFESDLATIFDRFSTNFGRFCGRIGDELVVDCGNVRVSSCSPHSLLRRNSFLILCPS